MGTLVLTIHYILCAFLIIVILLQAGKGANIGAVFGGASQTVFGSRGPATFLNKVTAVVALSFIVTSMWLAHDAKTQQSSSVIDKVPVSSDAVTPPAEKPAEPTTEPVKEEAK
jgi:preprotein translocase subunit SecG